MSDTRTISIAGQARGIDVRAMLGEEVEQVVRVHLESFPVRVERPPVLASAPQKAVVEICMGRPSVRWFAAHR